jgi:small ligand-binding sensory domain FIST
VVDGGARWALVIEGAVELCAVVSLGCRPVGKPFVITAAKAT